MAGTKNATTPPPSEPEGHFDMTELAMTVGRLEERISGIPGVGTTFLSSAGGSLAVAGLVIAMATVFLPREFDSITKDIKAIEEVVKPLKTLADEQGKKIDQILMTVSGTAKDLSSFSGRINMLEMASTADALNAETLGADLARLNEFLQQSPKTKNFFVLAGSGADPAIVVQAYQSLSVAEREQAATASLILGASLMRPYDIRKNQP